MVLLPLLYALILLSGMFLSVFYIAKFFLSLPIWLVFLSSIWLRGFTIICLILFCYSLIPAIQVAKRAKKRIKAFIGTIMLHHIRGLAWGFGLLIGLKNVILRKN